VDDYLHNHFQFLLNHQAKFVQLILVLMDQLYHIDEYHHETNYKNKLNKNQSNPKFFKKQNYILNLSLSEISISEIIAGNGCPSLPVNDST